MFAILRRSVGALPVALFLAWAVVASASDWSRFRGENGSGVSADSAPLPAQWSDAKNLKWSIDLPGNGHSCPIVVGDKVIVTCWTGADAPEMVRHLLCFDRETGRQIWDTPLDPVVQDEPYRGMFAQHGYASHTPVSDGERIYCFFGVSGVYAFDMDGKKVWGPVSVGTDFDDRGWGSASSPILYKDKVIITAGSESRTMFALDKSDGHEVWKQPAGALAGLWGTPVLLESPEGQTDIVLGVPGELWGVNPDTGKLRWYVIAGRGDSMCGSAIVEGGVAYVLGERGGQMVAVKGGGKGDVTGSHVLWAKDYQGRISTPVAAEGLIYIPAGGSLLCVDAATGDEVYNEQLQAPASSEAPSSERAALAEGENRGDRGGGGFGGGGFGGGRRGGGGGRGGFMSSDYSSPVIADGKIIFVRRQGAVHVVKAGREFEQLAVNKFEGEADYSASPAVSNGNLFIRSSKKLYCVAKTE